MAEKNNNGAEHWEFDFSKISAAQMDEFNRLQQRLIYRESLKILRLALVNVPEDWPEDLSNLPFRTTAKISKAFADAEKVLKALSSDAYHFDVETITAADVEDFMLFAKIGNYRKQTEVMVRYGREMKRNLDERLRAWMDTWTGADKKRYEGLDKADLLVQMNIDALMSLPYLDFIAARAKFMDEVLNLGKNLNG